VDSSVLCQYGVKFQWFFACLSSIMMEAETIFELLEFHSILTWLIAQERAVFYHWSQ
jgi:hypothetical protein